MLLVLLNYTLGRISMPGTETVGFKDGELLRSDKYGICASEFSRVASGGGRVR